MTAEENLRSNFFESRFGSEGGVWRLKGRLLDLLHTGRLHANAAYRRMISRAATQPKRRVLVVGVEVPERSKDLRQLMRSLQSPRHEVTAILAPLLHGKGKFQNINAALMNINYGQYDWIVVVDDDVRCEPGFIDKFISAAEWADLYICMPAHRFRSFQTFSVTRRTWNSIARVTNFVESGPITAFRRSIFEEVFPFPELRWAWGTDIAWSEKARSKGMRIGIVDATPIRHMRPVAESYDKSLARNEAQDFLAHAGIGRNREELLVTIETVKERINVPRPISAW